ncbi:MAG: class I SAM-dependent methyltransferase [Patescibacteria group bacterium]|nr:class I SAM-dependent methyltransferase [Patescibacteria group bacterium]
MDVSVDAGATGSGCYARDAYSSQGFRVFLDRATIHMLDEYSECDPYNVACNLQMPFQRHRVETTIAMVKLASDAIGGLHTLLDVACGEGHITAAIHEAFPEVKISAFDGSLSAIRRASQSFGGIDFAVADAYDPPYSNEYFDCVVCNNIWEHVPDPLRLVEAISKLMKPGGYPIVSTPSRYRLDNLLRVCLGKPVLLASCRHVTEYSVGQIMEQMRYAGFSVERVAGRVLCSRALRFRALAHRSVAACLRFLLRFLGSHHSMAATVFYLAKRLPAS